MPKFPTKRSFSRSRSMLVAVVLAAGAGLVGPAGPSHADTGVYQSTGLASWYGPRYHGRTTANGEQFDQMAMTAAHPKLPFGSLVEVTNLQNGKSVKVRINDRGPFVGARIIDVSMAVATELDFVNAGLAEVHVELVGRIFKSKSR